MSARKKRTKNRGGGAPSPARPVQSESGVSREEPQTDPASVNAGQRRWSVFAALLAVLLVVGAYSNYFHNSFHFDDTHTIQNNLFIRSLSNIPRFFSDARTFTSFEPNTSYRPLLVTTFALDYALAGGLKVEQFRITQLLLLLLTGVLLVPFYRYYLSNQQRGSGTRLLAIFCAALFCLHPVNTDPMNQIASRSDIASTAAVVLAFVLYLRVRPFRSLHLYLLPMILGALVKVSAVVFAPLLFLHAYLFETSGPLAGRLRRAAITAAPSFVAGGAMYILITSMQAKYWVPGGAPRAAYLMTQPWVWLHYLRLFFAPVGLTADTDMKAISDPFSNQFLLGVLGVVGLAVAFLVLQMSKKTAVAAFGLGWFGLALLPTSVIPLAEVANEHRLFFPYIGLVLAATALGRQALSTLEARRGRNVPRAALTAGMGIVLLVAAASTHARNKVWASEETLWLDVTRKSPNNGRGFMNYGLTQMGKGNYQVARAYFERAAELSPNYATNEINLGIVNGEQGDQEAAERHFRHALSLSDDATSNFFYGRWLVGRGRGPDALPKLERAVALSPANRDARDLLLRLYVAIGLTDEASRLMANTLALNPDDPLALRFRRGAFVEEPNQPAETLFNEGFQMIRAERFLEGALYTRQALALDPAMARAWNNLGWSIAKLGFFERSIEPFEKALSLDPGNELARNNLAWVRGEIGRRG